MSWSDGAVPACCTVLLIRLYLDNIGGKCNGNASCVFGKELAFLWCGRQFLEIISSFFSPLEIWVYFLQSLIVQTALCVSNKEMKHEMNVIVIVT